MLKRFVFASTAIAGLTSAALAADLPARVAPAAPVAAVPVFTWTGFYIGGNAGFISKNTRIDTFGNNGPVGGPSTIFNVANGARPGNVGVERGGFAGGGQIGFNYQFSRIVVGVEADAIIPTTSQTQDFVGSTGAVSRFRNDLRYLGTVRGRLGFTVDRFLVYGTGGLAYGRINNDALFFATPAAGGLNVLQFAGTRSGGATGFAAGGGVEYALPGTFNFLGSTAVTLRGEAFYYDLGRRNVIVADTGLAPAATRGQSYTSQFRTNGVVARAAINFKFGGF